MNLFCQAEVKALEFRRHKLICHVIIMENQKQGTSAVSRSLWDADRDNSSTACFENESLVAVANVYAVYFE